MPGPLILCGPSGVGKSTLLKRLFAAHPESFGFSVSHTTRAPRAGETDGTSYHFVSRESFDRLIAEEAFIEYATFAQNTYGTSVRALQDIRERGQRAILDIDLQGVLRIRDHFSHSTGPNPLPSPPASDHPTQLKAEINTAPNAPVDRPTFVYLCPPTYQSLRTRLTSRATEDPQTLARRLDAARNDLQAAAAAERLWHHVIVNDDLDTAFSQLERIALDHSEASHAHPAAFPAYEFDA